MMNSSIRVLHIDDSSEYLNFIRIALIAMNSDYQIECALTVTEARDKLNRLSTKENSYHLIIMDFDLGCSTNGLELIRKYLYRKTDTPVIMLSAYDDEYLKKTAFSLGVAEYISKSELIGDFFKLHNIILRNIGGSVN